MSKTQIVEKFYPEIGVGGFTRIDGAIFFYTQIATLLRPDMKMLDFGAGRGEPLADDGNNYRRQLAHFQGKVAHVEGSDPDPIVLENPFVDHATVTPIGEPLPFADNSFDIIVTRSVFEHVDTAEQTASELMRILAPGGWLCALTPNKWSYVALAASLVPNRLHNRILRYVQPFRKPEDIFPTRYKMNSHSKLRSLFGKSGTVYIVGHSAEPAYYFGSSLIFSAFKLIHKFLPDRLATHLYIFVRAPDDKKDQAEGKS